MTVTLFRQKAKGPEVIGTISLREGKLVADPPDAPGLLYVLSETVYRYDADGSITILESGTHPADFLKALPAAYHGTYFWAGNLQP